MTRQLAPVDTPVPPTSDHTEVASEKLYGTWHLVSFIQTILATGETVDVFGKAPTGFIHYGRDGRMMVLMVKDERPKPADLSQMTDQERVELFKTLVAYAGTYSLDSGRVTHHLDISWNQIFTGTEQVRNIELDGCKFIMSTNPQPRSQDGKIATSVLTWERLE